MIRSVQWPAQIAAVAIAALCLAPGAKAERHGWDSVTVAPEQSPAGCRTDCTVGKQSLVTLSGVDAATMGKMVVRDSRGRYAAVSQDFHQLLIFDAAGRLLASPRPKYERLVSLFVGPAGAVQAYDLGSGSLLTFDANYQVTSTREQPQYPALPLSGGRFLVMKQINEPGLVGHPLHVMSKDGSIIRSFGGDGGPFHSDDTFKNLRAVCLNPDGTIWSIAPGGRLLERWDTSTGRRVAQVTVKSTWFRESSRMAPPDQVANPLVLSIWSDNDLVWLLYQAPDPHWIPRRMTERELIATDPDRISDWVLEAVRSDTGNGVAMKTFDRRLRRWVGSFAIVSEAASPNRANAMELWKPIVVNKDKKQ
ncbi:MAG: hypothetical protein WCQ64_11430 [Acidobacteriota bacterium]